MNSDTELKANEDQGAWGVKRLVLHVLIPACKMGAVCPYSVPRQHALPTLGDTHLSLITRTLTLSLLLLLLRRDSWCIPIPIHRRCSQTRAVTTATTETNQIRFAHLSLPKQVPSQALAKFLSEHLPPRRARHRRWCKHG